MTTENDKKFTALMAVYDKDDHILFSKAVKSVFENEIRPSQMVLVVDGPVNENIEKTISDLTEDYNLNIIRSTVNVGLTKSLNIGLANINTKWVARADADDICLTNRFSTQLKYALMGYQLIGSSILEIGKNGEKYSIRRPPLNQNDIAKAIKYRNPFNHMTVLFETELVRSVGGYPDIPFREDYGLWASLIARGVRAINISDILVHATAGPDMYQRRRGIKSFKGEYILQKHLIKVGVSSYPTALLMGMIRALTLMLPVKILALVYTKLLRKPNNA